MGMRKTGFSQWGVSLLPAAAFVAVLCAIAICKYCIGPTYPGKHIACDFQANLKPMLVTSDFSYRTFCIISLLTFEATM